MSRYGGTSYNTQRPSTGQPPPSSLYLNHVPNPCYLDGRGKVRLNVSALADGYLFVMRDILCVHTHTYPHTCKDTKQVHAQRRLSPEFYDNIIRLPILISSGVLMMIGVLPIHPSPHVSFVRLWLVDGIGGWVMWLISCLDEVGRSYTMIYGEVGVG